MNRSLIISECRILLLGRQNQYAQEIANLDSAAAADTKSSAGDKYETGREMIAQTRRLMEHNLDEIAVSLSILDRMAMDSMAAQPTENIHSTIRFGSLVETSQGLYLLGLSLGELILSNGLKILALSPASPLGKTFLGKSEGHQVLWKGNQVQILRVHNT